MKKRILAAVIVAAASCVLYRVTEQLATAERGYTAFGGEELLFISGITFAICILAGAFTRNKKKSGSQKATASTESEQSESNSP